MSNIKNGKEFVAYNNIKRSPKKKKENSQFPEIFKKNRSALRAEFYYY